MKIEVVLNLDAFKDKTDNSIILDTWINAYKQYLKNDDILISRIKKAFDIYNNGVDYCEFDFDGEFPLGKTFEASFANKYFSIEDIVKMQLNKLDDIDIQSYSDLINTNVRKGFICELKKDYDGALDYYLRTDHEDIMERGLYLRNKEDFKHLKEELDKGNMDYIKELENKRISKNVKNFWNVCLETAYTENRFKKLMHSFQLEWRKLCARYGDKISMYYLAIAHVRGYPCKRDEDLSYYYAMRSYNEGQRKAALIIGMLYEEGYGCPKDIKEAVKYYKIAAEDNVIGAMLRLNSIYREGKDGITPDEKEANKYIFIDKLI